MKMKITIGVVAGVALVMFPGNIPIACGQGMDGLLEGVIKSMGTSDNSGREAGRYRGSDDDRKWSDRDSHHDDNDRSSQRRNNDPDLIVRRAYEDILNREPDKEGLRLYRSRLIDDNWSEKDVRNDLRKSLEHAQVKSESAEQIVRRAYQDILGRDPDREGMATYRAKLQNEGWSERDVRSDLKKSAERRENGEMTTEQARQIVERAYRSVLGRDPDSGSAIYVEKVKRDHWSENDVAKELRKSPEYRQKHGK